jgi:acetyl esterase
VGVPTFPRLPLNIERGALNTLGRAPQPVHRVIGVRSAPSDGASLHPEAALTLRLLSIAPSSGFESMPLAKGRALIDHDAAVLGGPPLPMARVEGVRIPTPSGGIGGRLYVADERNTDRILVYFHGGGFVVGSLDSVDTVCRFIARHAGVAVLSVDWHRSTSSRRRMRMPWRRSASRSTKQPPGAMTHGSSRSAVTPREPRWPQCCATTCAGPGR